MPPDKIDEAIAAVEEPKVVQVEMVQVQVKMLGREDRPATVVMPRDTTDLELLGMVAAILQIGDQLRSQRPSSRLILPNGAIQ